jgi:hypothetical protein
MGATSLTEVFYFAIDYKSTVSLLNQYGIAVPPAELYAELYLYSEL